MEIKIGEYKTLSKQEQREIFPDAILERGELLCINPINSKEIRVSVVCETIKPQDLTNWMTERASWHPGIEIIE